MWSRRARFGRGHGVHASVKRTKSPGGSVRLALAHNDVLGGFFVM
jgi:hypothetical protein